jgi:endonuclease/exonuclease/phosphatase family metal-dependent hydrolase
MDMRLCAGNVRSLNRACSLTRAAKEISKCKLDLLGVQEVRWDRGGTEPAGKYIFFFMERGISIMN